jgi:hypothetical protein
MNIFLNFLRYFIIALTIFSCSKPDPVTGETPVIEPSVEKRARDFADKGGGIFGDINNRRPGGGSSSVDFASSNVLWRATLKS